MFASSKGFFTCFAKHKEFMLLRWVVGYLFIDELLNFHLILNVLIVWQKMVMHSIPKPIFQTYYVKGINKGEDHVYSSSLEEKVNHVSSWKSALKNYI